MAEDFSSKSDYELKSIISKASKSFPILASRLTDGGAKLKAKLQCWQDELERREQKRPVCAPSINPEPVILYDKDTEVNANYLAKGRMATGPGEQADMNKDRSTMNPTQVSSQPVDEDEPTSQIRGNNATQTTSKQSLKRKSGELDLLESEVVRIFKSISCLLDAEKGSALAMHDTKNAFVHEVDVCEKTCDKRKRLFQVICTLPGLTPEQIVKATRLIGQDKAKMDLFYSMPDDYKLIFARQEINESS